MCDEIPGEHLGEEFAGYVLKVTGGNDKQGFPMMQGVLKNHRVRLMLKEGSKCYSARKRGERKRKSVRGCIIGPDMSVISLIVVKKGDNDIAGLTDDAKPRRLGPKRATRIRALLQLGKDEDVRKHVLRREIQRKDGKTAYKAPKIQRLVTPQRLQRKRHERAVRIARYTKSRAEAEEYNTALNNFMKEAREKRRAALNKKRSVSRKATGSTTTGSTNE